MTSKLLEETGYFWWGDTPLPSGQFAPESAVVGKLSIDEEGYSRLELEGVLPNELGPLAAFGGGGSPFRLSAEHRSRPD